MDIKHITDNKKFWHTMKPVFSDKGTRSSKITLIEGDRIIFEDTEVAKTLNTCFDNAVASLNINVPKECITDTTDTIDLIDKIILKYSNHPSIISIKNNIVKGESSFNEIFRKLQRKIRLNVNKTGYRLYFP